MLLVLPVQAALERSRQETAAQVATLIFKALESQLAHQRLAILTPMQSHHLAAAVVMVWVLAHPFREQMKMGFQAEVVGELTHQLALVAHLPTQVRRRAVLEGPPPELHLITVEVVEVVLDHLPEELAAMVQQPQVVRVELVKRGHLMLTDTEKAVMQDQVVAIVLPEVEVVELMAAVLPERVERVVVVPEV